MVDIGTNIRATTYAGYAGIAMPLIYASLTLPYPYTLTKDTAATYVSFSVFVELPRFFAVSLLSVAAS